MPRVFKILGKGVMVMTFEPEAGGLQPDDRGARAFEAEFLRSCGPLPPLESARKDGARGPLP